MKCLMRERRGLFLIVMSDLSAPCRFSDTKQRRAVTTANGASLGCVEKAEGDAMKHCVFRCEYYAKSDTLVLSAHDKSGNWIETIELSLTEGKVIQSR